MTKVIDMEIGAPKIGRAKEIGEAIRDRPGTPFPESLDRPDGYGFDNYNHIFGGGESGGAQDPGSLEQTVAEMDASGVEFGLLTGAPNAEIGQIHRDFPGRFKIFAWINPLDGMRGVRELERLVREDGADGLRVSSLYNNLAASDRRYYPLYAKCCEIGRAHV